MLSERQLLDIKKDIDTAKTKVSELTGKKEYLMQELKTKWGLESVEDAENEVKRIGKEIDDLDTTIKKGIREIEEKYNV